MCGIAGWAAVADRSHPGPVRADGTPAAAVRRMCAAMRHRGPDDLQVVAREDGTGLDRPRAAVALGISRLAVVDVAAGRQPFVSRDGRFAVVLNGEIYDHVELRARLVARGHRFTTGSDAEVLLHLVEDRPDDLASCLAELNGMFAAAVHDARTGEVHLVRDRIGVKPVYYAADARRLVFASDLRALQPEVPGELDPEALAELLVLTYLPAPRTPLSAVRKLEPGTVLTWRAGELAVRRWWSWPTPGVGDPAEARSAGVAERIRELVVDAVRLQLRADVPLGLLLSGGVDSTAILWAARELGADVPGFCVDFGEDGGDTGYARLAAERLGADVRTLSVSAGGAADELPTAVGALAEPLGDPAVLPSLLVCRVAAEHVTVLLSGTGADELWGGYGRYVLPGADPETYVGELSVMPEDGVRRALGLPAGEPVTERLRALLGAGSQDRAGWRMQLDGVLSLPGDLLPLLDMTSMAVSLEARVPLLDHRLVELAGALSGPARVPGGELKALFRTALRGRVPDEVLDRPKRGFNPPVPDWLAGPLGRPARRLLAAPGGLVGPVLDPAVVRGWFAPTAAPEGLRALRLWVLLVADLWWRQRSGTVGATLDDVLAAVA